MFQLLISWRVSQLLSENQNWPLSELPYVTVRKELQIWAPLVGVKTNRGPLLMDMEWRDSDMLQGNYIKIPAKRIRNKQPQLLTSSIICTIGS